jgi:hypothetical protein
MYRWGRAAGLDRFPALIGALALEGSGFLVARAALFPSIVLTFSWLPIWLWRAEALIRSKHWARIHNTLWLAMTLGLGLLAGHAQTAFYGGLLLAAYLLLRTTQEGEIGRGGDRERGRNGSASRFTPYVSRLTFYASRFTPYALALFVALGFAAIQLLPTAELMVLSQRSSGADYEIAMTYSMWPWRLITLAAPDFFGNPGRGNYWGYATYWEDAAYMGVLPLLLAIHAVVAGGKGAGGRGSKGAEGQRRTVTFWLAVAIFSLVLAMGKNTPIFPFLFRHVPTFDLFRSPARWLAVTTVALAALAAWGAQRWPRGHAERRRGALAVVVGGALLLGGLGGPRLVAHMPNTFGPATARLGVMLAVCGALTLLRRDTSYWQAAVVTFLALDLLIFGWPLTPTVERELYHGDTATANDLGHETGPLTRRTYWPTDPANPASTYDAEYRVKFDYFTFDDFGPRDADHWREVREALLPNTGMLDDVAAVNNFDPLLVGRYVDLLEAAVETPALLRVMGATHVLSDQAWAEAPAISGHSPATLYRLPQSLGRAWVVPDARHLPSDEMLAALADPAFDPTAEVLLEGTASAERGTDDNLEPRLVLQDTPNRVKIRVTLNAPGYLVLSDTWYPGWRASVDGQPAQLFRANYAFRAVRLEAGEHAVEMVYRPPSLLVGGAISLATWMLLIVGLLVSRRMDSAVMKNRPTFICGG